MTSATTAQSQRTVIWDPAPQTLFSLPENAGAVSYVISTEVLDKNLITGTTALVPVARYHAEITPEQSILTLEPRNKGITVMAPTLFGLFPIQRIDYRVAQDVVRIHDWNSLPESADDIVAFHPGAERMRTFQLTVNAELQDGSVEKKTYLIEIHHDWTTGRDKLRREIDARRHATR